MAKDETVKAQQKEEKEDFFDKILDDSEQPEDKKNIIIQYRIINNHGIMAGDGAKFENVRIHDEERHRKKKENIFSTEGEWNNWLLDNYETYPMALMIASAVFDCFPYTWVLQAADMLFSLFHMAGDEKERRHGITELLSAFGAEICQGELNTYTGKTPIEVIRLTDEEYSEKILRFIWRECPGQRDHIISWLKRYSMKTPMSMSRQAIVVMGKLACWDYYYFLDNMVEMISREKRIATDMVSAQIVISLYSCGEYQENVEHLMVNWNRGNNIHYLLTNLFICAELTDKSHILQEAVSRYVREAMNEIREPGKNEYLKNIYNFFAAGMRAFTFYRILIDQLYELTGDRLSLREKQNICDLFLRFFMVDVDLARLKEGEDAILIRLCHANQETGRKLCILWQMVWQCRPYRQAFYGLMAKYDANIRRSGSLNSVENFVRKALGEICTKEMQRDICNKIYRRAKDE